MNINQFMFRLNNELNENGFYNVEVYKEHNKHDNTYLIRVIAKRENKKYDYGYSINKNWLDDKSIKEIVDQLLNK